MDRPNLNKDSGVPNPRYVGGSSFPDGKPVCKPVFHGRHPKPLEGPVHPGFKGKPKPAKKSEPPAGVVVRSDQNNDVYKPLKKVVPKSIGNSRKK